MIDTFYESLASGLHTSESIPPGLAMTVICGGCNRDYPVPNSLMVKSQPSADSICHL